MKGKGLIILDVFKNRRKSKEIEGNHTLYDIKKLENRWHVVEKRNNQSIASFPLPAFRESIKYLMLFNKGVI